jgi:hypothetical protein
MKAGGIALLAIAALCFCVAAFFGYFSWANFGSAERLAVSLPDGAEFVVAAVKRKAENQMMTAGGAFVGFLLFGIPGLVLLGKGKAAPQQAPSY